MLPEKMTNPLKKTNKKEEKGKNTLSNGNPVAEKEPLDSDEALFQSLENEKKAKRKKRIRIIIIAVVAVALILVIGTIVLQRKVRTSFASSSDEVLSAQAEKGSISTLVSGSGQLVNVDTETVSVPSGVEVTETLVEYGDTVEKGDVLASVDMASVRTTLSSVQDEIETLDSEIADADSDAVSSYITTSMSGRVKALYAEVDEDVEDIMGEHGALAILSLDGYMYVEIDAGTLKKGDAVVVTRADGTELEGKVESVAGGKAKVLVTDDGPELDEQVTVKDTSGKTLGEGTLAIHSPMSITGYAGTIRSIECELNGTKDAYSVLFTLSNTTSTANYNALLRERSDLEDTLVQLLDLERNGALVAPISGSIYYVVDLDDEDDDSDEEILDIVMISPDKQMEVTITVDESDIMSLELGQKADVTVSSVGDDVYEGVVTEIDKTYTNEAYTATITIDKVEGMIPGMTASVDIRIEGTEDALIIPADALHETSGGYFVYTSYNEDTQEYGGQVTVVPGLSNDDYVEIKSGLNEGDTVYYVESEEFPMMMGNFGGGGQGGGMPGGGGGGQGGGMPSGGGGQGGGMPGGGGGAPGGFGG